MLAYLGGSSTSLRMAVEKSFLVTPQESPSEVLQNPGHLGPNEVKTSIYKDLHQVVMPVPSGNALDLSLYGPKSYR